MRLSYVHSCDDDTLREATTGIAARILRCHPATLYKMRDRKEIECIRTASGRCLWNVRQFLARSYDRHHDKNR